MNIIARLNLFRYSQFILYKKQYILPAKPQNPTNLRQFVIQQWTQNDPTKNTSLLNQAFRTLQQQELEAYQKQYQEQKRLIQQWLKIHGPPKKPVHYQLEQRGNLLKENSEQMKGWTMKQKQEKVSQILEETKPTEEAEAKNKEKYQELNERYHKIMEEYKDRHSIPNLRKIQPVDAFLKSENNVSLKDRYKQFAQLTAEQQKEFVNKAEQINAEQDLKWQQLATKYNMDVNELKQEIKRQLKLEKTTKEASS